MRLFDGARIFKADYVVNTLQQRSNLLCIRQVGIQFWLPYLKVI
jgi:hypothetical protein